MEVAEVYVWNQLVGAVSWDSSKGFANFEYSSSFKKSGINLAPFFLPINSSKRIFSFPELRKTRNTEFDTFKGLPGLLADVLPDHYGSRLINIWLAQQGRPLESMNPVEMLCFIGTRGMGALEFQPVTIQEQRNTFSIEIDSLVSVAKRILSKKESFITNLKQDEEKAVMDILKVGTSAGGARPKAVIAYNEKTGEVKSGQTKTPKDFEHWLLKLDGVSDIQLGNTKGYGRVEMAYYNMALACGIDMMPSKLLEENGRAHFMTKRFDREQGDVKHHIQTFCAMKHFDFNLIQSFSYEQLFQTIRELQLDYRSTEQMFRRMAFNVIAKNCDDHTKNFAFRLKQDSDWELAPAYDICHAYKPNHIWVSKHALSVNNKRENINFKDLIAAEPSIKKAKAIEIVEQILEVVSNWKYYAKECKVSKSLSTEIEKTFEIISIN